MTALHDLTATEQLAALEDRQVSSRELTQHYLDRIDRHGERLGAFVAVFHEQALAAADRADEGPRTGLLHGLPFALKDLHPTAGLPTTMGSAALRSWVPTVDAPAVGALRAAGPVVLGKTHAPEMGPTCYTETALARPAVTPYDEAFSASGSSGGSASAVAAGLVPLAHASDGLGSIRTPAANCGLVGVKPSRGRLRGSGIDWSQGSVEGPVARTVQDAALLLDAIGPAAVTEIWRRPAWEADAHRRAARERPPTGLRIGVVTDSGFDLEVHPECLTAVTRTAADLEDLGHVVEQVPVPALPRLGDIEDAIVTVLKTRLSMGCDALFTAEDRPLLMPFTRWLCEGGRDVSVQAFAEALTALAQAAGMWCGVLTGYDAVLMPTTTAPPLPVGALRLDDGPASAHAMIRWSAFTPLANFSGAPAISLPVHLTPEGLPIGVQLTAGPDQDCLLLSLAASLEERGTWARTTPAAWA